MTREELRKTIAAAMRPACGYRDFDWEKIADHIIEAIGEAGFSVLTHKVSKVLLKTGAISEGDNLAVRKLE